MSFYSKRRAWLSANSLLKDPFSPRAFGAENDPLLEKGMPAFVTTEIYKNLVAGTLDSSCRIVLGKSGSGKTTIRKRLFADMNPQWTQSKEFFPIQYVNHSYTINHADIDSHVDRIIEIATKILGDNYSIESNWDRYDSPSDRINFLAWRIQQKEYKKAILIIDNLDKNPFESTQMQYQKIESLLLCKEIFENAGIATRVFMPEDCEKFLGGDFDEETVKIAWNDDLLIQLINERLWACIDPNASHVRSAPPLGYLCDGKHINAIQDRMVNYGKTNNSPREMWRFGNLLIVKHLEANTQSSLIFPPDILDSVIREYQYGVRNVLYQIVQNETTTPHLSASNGGDLSKINTIVEMLPNKINNALDIYETLKIEDDPDYISAWRREYNIIIERYSKGIYSLREKDIEENILISKIRARLDVLRRRLL